MLTMFVISKMDAVDTRAFCGLACHRAGIPLGGYYDTEAQAEEDCKKLNNASPIGFQVRPVIEETF